jgi:hypothetical protein
MNRYRVARAMGREKYKEVVREDEELLNGFGLRLLSVDCGLRAAIEEELKGERINPWNVVTIDEKTWKWLRPLLCRLRTAEARAALSVVQDPASEEKVALPAK